MRVREIVFTISKFLVSWIKSELARKKRLIKDDKELVAVWYQRRSNSILNRIDPPQPIKITHEDVMMARTPTPELARDDSL